jgi:hypothetical protein
MHSPVHATGRNTQLADRIGTSVGSFPALHEELLAEAAHPFLHTRRCRKKRTFAADKILKRIPRIDRYGF